MATPRDSIVTRLITHPDIRRRSRERLLIAIPAIIILIPPRYHGPPLMKSRRGQISCPTFFAILFFSFFFFFFSRVVNETLRDFHTRWDRNIRSLDKRIISFNFDFYPNANIKKNKWSDERRGGGGRRKRLRAGGEGNYKAKNFSTDKVLLNDGNAEFVVERKQALAVRIVCISFWSGLLHGGGRCNPFQSLSLFCIVLIHIQWPGRIRYGVCM